MRQVLPGRGSSMKGLGEALRGSRRPGGFFLKKRLSFDLAVKLNLEGRLLIVLQFYQRNYAEN